MNINLTKHFTLPLLRWLNGHVGRWYRLGRLYGRKLETRYFPFTVGFTLSVAVLALLTLTVGGVFPINKFAHDVFIFLDGASRVLQGQVPHRDFSTGLGPVVYWLYALGLVVSGPDASAIVVLYAVVYLFSFLAAYLVASRRFNRVLGLGMALFFAGVAACPAHYGLGVRDTSVSSFYNRLGYAWVGILAVGLCLPRRPCRQKLGFADPLVLSLCLALLLFMKFTFGIAGLGLAGLALLTVAHRPQWKAAFCGTLLLWIAVGFWGIGWAWKPMLREMGYLGLPGKSGLVGNMLSQAFSQNLLPLGALMVVQLFRLISAGTARPGATRRWFVLWAAETGAFAGLTVFLAAANQYHTEVAVLPAFLCILAWRAFQESSGLRKEIAYVTVSIATIVAVVMVGGYGVRNYLSFAYAGARKFYGYRAERLAPPNLAALPVLRGGGGGWNEGKVSFQEALNEGYEALAKYTVSADSVCVLDFTNPFSFALQRPRPPGARLWWFYPLTFSEQYHPLQDSLFSGVAVVMVPKYPDEPETTQKLQEIYGDTLRLEFAPLVETKHWRVLKRTLHHGAAVP
jgi:hypothetical protein